MLNEVLNINSSKDKWNRGSVMNKQEEEDEVDNDSS